MKTIRFTKADIDVVAQMLQEGQIVAFPTDTVYGLACICHNEEALQNLKNAKIRPDTKPIATMVANLKQMCEIAYVSDTAKKLVKAYMPGALTLILKKKECIPAYMTNGLSTIGIRMPDDPFVLALIEKCGSPLLVTSANVSGQETGKTMEEVLAQLDGRIDAIVEGEISGGVASTIIDIQQEKPIVLRQGPISEAEIQKVCEEGEEK